MKRLLLERWINMLPLNYAILKYFTLIDEADTQQVMSSLQGEYGGFRAFKEPAVTETLMAAEANGLLAETHYYLDNADKLRVYYRATDEGRLMIEKYIG
jgi:DNA-binding PadR family transcriptional regulator